MSELSPRQAFSPSCPSGGTWYACTNDSFFVGCCNGSVSPCALGCPDGLLEPASFDPAFWGTFPDQECSIGSQWYTCANSMPPFMGCCKTNPCNAGCPTGNLTPGYLSSDQALAAPFESDASAPSDSAPSGSAMSGSAPSGSAPSGSAPSGSAPSGSAPSGSAPSGSAPSGSAPSGGAPSGSAPSGSAPSGSAPSTTVTIPVVFVTVGPPTSSSPPSSTIATANTTSDFPSFSQSTVASSTIIIPSVVATESIIAAQSGSGSKPTSGPVLVSAVMGGVAGGAAVIALLLGLSLYLWRRHASRREKEHLGPMPTDPRENAYTDSSPITPIQAYRTFNFPPTDKEYGSSTSSSTSPRKVQPLLPTRPAYITSTRSRSPPASPLSRSLSELESGRDGIKVAAELDGHALARLNTRDLGREGRGSEIESPVNPDYMASSTIRTKQKTERRVTRARENTDNYI